MQSFNNQDADYIINNQFFTNLILEINNRLSSDNLQGYRDLYELLKSKLVNVSDLEILILLKIFEHNINFRTNPNLNYTPEYLDSTKRLIFEYYRSDSENKINVLEKFHSLTKIEFENYVAAQHLGLQNKLNSSVSDSVQMK